MGIVELFLLVVSVVLIVCFLFLNYLLWSDLKSGD